MTELVDSITSVRGFKAAGVHCGLKKKEGALDFALIVSDTPCMAAGVFTTNQVKAAPVLVDMERLKTHSHSIRAVAINAGNANACTGQQGIENTLETARYVAEKIGCDENEVLVLSTGVIGVQLAMDKIKHGIDLAVNHLGDYWLDAAQAIMTTDTRPKMASIQAGNDSYSIAGIAKGSGMIAPNMATMLSVVVTDAQIPAGQSYNLLKSASDLSYNRIVVDGDTSTNDTVFFLSNALGGQLLNAHLNTVCTKLAQDIVRDGEGATKFITVHVTGAQDDHSAWQIANTIAISPLVKTAFFGEDANWGRILMAAGRAGVPLNQNLLSVYLNEGEHYQSEALPLLLEGVPCSENDAAAGILMKADSLYITLDCGLGSGSSTIWTSDFSHEYVSINADYRT